MLFVKGTDFLLEGGENTLRLAYSGVTADADRRGRRAGWPRPCGHSASPPDCQRQERSSASKSATRRLNVERAAVKEQEVEVVGAQRADLADARLVGVVVRAQGRLAVEPLRHRRAGGGRAPERLAEVPLAAAQ